MFWTADYQSSTSWHFGSAGHTVAVDESVVAKAKPGNAHARLIPSQWVLRGIDLGKGKFFVELVPQWDVATLKCIMQRNIALGTCFWSDQWVAYNGLNAFRYIHETIKHT